MENMESETPSSYIVEGGELSIACSLLGVLCVIYFLCVLCVKLFLEVTHPDSFGITPLERGIILCFYEG